ncbi:MAG: ABC transporter [Betaproteobacteria bacterium HGW-Betaproteobacteria-6]|jgi:zinc transport system permease protein|nr:MAG: ABC transporter [Betaproteobacteria bacterium HGW-Betaproteobacteria-6]
MSSEIFLIPFLTGLVCAIVLPLLGCYLRLRDQWLAALAYAHVAAAGALLALLVGVPPVLGGLSMAALAGAGRRLFARRLSGGAGDALLLLGGWSGAVLLAANAPMAERLGHALFDGQLYFASSQELWPVAIGGAVALLALRALSSRLLLARVYPDLFRLRGLPAWPIQVGFDLMAALGLALATMSLGVMGAFALVFIPPWLAFRRAANWRSGLGWAVAISLVAYVSAFALALGLDQPFGPVLAVLLALAGLLVA